MAVAVPPTAAAPPEPPAPPDAASAPADRYADEYADTPGDTVSVGGYAVPRYMTLEQFEAYPFPKAEPIELVLGEVRVSPLVTLAHSRIVRNLVWALETFVRAHKLGEVFGDSVAYVLPGLPDTRRSPDVSFVRAGRLPELAPPRGAARVAPDLAVEVLSPNDTYVEVDERREQMLAAGASCWWLVDPRRRRVEVHTPDGNRRVAREGEVLDGAPVLPGFSMPVAEVFDAVGPDPAPPAVA